MFSFAAPSDNNITAFLQAQMSADFSYPEVGATRSPNFPPHYTEDHRRAFIATGDAVFRAACDALDNWRMFDISWMRFHADGAAHENQTVVIAARVGVVWCVNAARVLYRFDESYDGMRRHGFAYGTLAAHVERGEEVFQITQNITDGRVYYDLRAFSRPAHLLTQIGYPLTRMYQRRFGADSGDAMRRTVRANVGQKTLNT